MKTPLLSYKYKCVSRITKSSVFFFLLFSCSYQNLPIKSDKNYFNKKSFTNTLNGCVYINGGVLIQGNVPEYLDYTNIYYNAWLEPVYTKDNKWYGNYKDFKIDDFIIKQTEVTNKEYRQFTNWVRDSIARSIQAQYDTTYYLYNSSHKLNWEKPIDWSDTIHLGKLIIPETKNNSKSFQINSNAFVYSYYEKGEKIELNIYPDTSCWNKDHPRGYYDSWIDKYFIHPGFKNYPVVGVSYSQAKAYCHWLEKNLNQLSYKKGYGFKIRLPNDKELEYISLGKNEIGKDTSALKGHDYTKFENNILKGNNLNDRLTSFNSYGTRDHCGVQIITPIDDGSLFTNEVCFYHPNDFNVYGCRGNVAEWTTSQFNDLYILNSIINDLRFYTDASTIYKSELDKYYNNFDQFLDDRNHILSKYNTAYDIIKNLTLGIEINYAFLTDKKPNEEKFLDLFKTIIIKFPGFTTSDRSKFKEYIYDQTIQKLSKNNIIQLSSFYESDNRLKLKEEVERNVDWFYDYSLDKINQTLEKKKYNGQRMVVGGSWADPIIYTYPGARRMFPDSAQHSFIGFRYIIERYPIINKRVSLISFEN